MSWSAPTAEGVVGDHRHVVGLVLAVEVYLGPPRTVHQLGHHARDTARAVARSARPAHRRHWAARAPDLQRWGRQADTASAASSCQQQLTDNRRSSSLARPYRAATRLVQD